MNYNIIYDIGEYIPFSCKYINYLMGVFDGDDLRFAINNWLLPNIVSKYICICTYDIEDGIIIKYTKFFIDYDSAYEYMKKKYTEENNGLKLSNIEKYKAVIKIGYHLFDETTCWRIYKNIDNALFSSDEIIKYLIDNFNELKFIKYDLYEKNKTYMCYIFQRGEYIAKFFRSYNDARKFMQTDYLNMLMNDDLDVIKNNGIYSDSASISDKNYTIIKLWDIHKFYE